MKYWRRILTTIMAMVMLVPTIAVSEEAIQSEPVYEAAYAEVLSESEDVIEETEPVGEDAESIQIATEEAQSKDLELPPEEVVLELGEEIAEPVAADYAADAPVAQLHELTIDPAAKAQTLTVNVGDKVRIYVKDATVKTWKPGKKNIVSFPSGEVAPGGYTEFHVEAAYKKLSLKATLTGHKKKSVTVYLVINDPYIPTSVSFTNEMLKFKSVPLGTTIPLSDMVAVEPSYAVKTLTYKASGAAKVAKDGTLTTTKAGTATITVTASNNKKAKATFRLTVLANKVTGMSEKPGSADFAAIAGGWTLWPISITVGKKGLDCQFYLLNATGEKVTKLENMQLTLAVGTPDNIIAGYSNVGGKALSASVSNKKTKTLKLTLKVLDMTGVFLPDHWKNGTLFFDINQDVVKLNSKKNSYAFIPTKFPTAIPEPEPTETPSDPTPTPATPTPTPTDPTPAPATPTPVPVAESDFTIDENGVVTGYKGAGGVIEIPAKDVEGHAVTAVGAGAFKGNATITSVTIPSTVTSIGASAFEDCKALESVIIPNGVETIDNAAFKNCSNLKTMQPY